MSCDISFRCIIRSNSAHFAYKVLSFDLQAAEILDLLKFQLPLELAVKQILLVGNDEHASA